MTNTEITFWLMVMILVTNITLVIIVAILLKDRLKIFEFRFSPKDGINTYIKTHLPRRGNVANKKSRELTTESAISFRVIDVFVPLFENNIIASENISDISIFYLLGIEEAKQHEREQFTQELISCLIESFIEKDLETLLSRAKLEEYRKIKENSTGKAVMFPTKDEKIIDERALIFWKENIANLQDIWKDKAYKLKEEMFEQRIEEYEEYLRKRDNATSLNITKLANKFRKNKQYRLAATLLNAIDLE